MDPYRIMADDFYRTFALDTTGPVGLPDEYHLGGDQTLVASVYSVFLHAVGMQPMVTKDVC